MRWANLTAILLFSTLSLRGTTLVLATYLGGVYSTATCVAVDSAGNIYIAGSAAKDFPVKNAFQPVSKASDLTGFIAKFDPTGQNLIYATFLGGSGVDSIQALAVDAAGNVYVTGRTTSADFPTANPLQASLKGTQNAFVAKLNAAGTALLYSTYLGGGGAPVLTQTARLADTGTSIRVDDAGDAYVGGITVSKDFPLANPSKSSLADAVDGFVAKLNPAGSALLFSTYLGGSAADQVNSLALDSAANAYLTGSTCSSDFPLLAPLIQPVVGVCNAFVAKFTSAGAMIYSTILGGDAQTSGNAIAVDSTGNAYVTGATQAGNFPLKNAFQSKPGDVFLSKIAADGSAFIYSTYFDDLGHRDAANAIAVNGSGEVYIAGGTASSNLPVKNAIQALSAGGLFQGQGFPFLSNPVNAFVSKFSADGSQLLYSTFLGGSYIDTAYALVLDVNGQAYVAGQANSTDFPSLNAYQPRDIAALSLIFTPAGSGVSNAFLAKIADASPSPSGCQFEFGFYSGPPASITTNGPGGSGRLKVLTNSEVCAWQPTSNVPWITFTPISTPQSGIGTFQYSVAPNTGFAARSGTVGVGGKTIPFTQGVQNFVYASASGVAGRPGGIARVPLSVSAPFGINELSVTLTVAPVDSAPPLVAPLGFQPDAAMPQPTVSTTGTSTISLTWRSFTPFKGPASLIGELLVPIPAGAIVGQSYSVQATNGPPAQFTSSALVPGPTATIVVGNPVPVVSWLYPQSSALGAPSVQLTINGEGFTPSSALQWNGSPRTATFISETQLQAQIPAADLATPGSVQITVINPAPNGGQSNASPFFVGALVPPQIRENGIVNGASYTASLVGGGIASIFGANLSPAIVLATKIPLPTVLNGTSVRVDGVLAPLFYVSPTQINFEMPAEALARTQSSILVINNGSSSTAQTVSVLPAAPALFTTNSAGSGQGVVVNTDYNLVAPVSPCIPGYRSCRPASAGDAVIVYGTGFGALQFADVQDGYPGGTISALPAQATVGGIPAKVLRTGMETGFVALGRVDIVIPAGVAPGPAVPVVVTINGVVSNTVMIAVN